VAGDTAYDIEVLPVDVALYVSSGASWQSVSEPIVNVTGPVNGFTVTILVPVVVPHSPTAVAVIVAVPENEASQSITPVDAFIVPAATGDTEYVITVLCADVAVYISSAASWHTVSAPEVKLTSPVKAFTVTVLVPVVTPHSPVAVAVIVAMPKNDAFQSISPVDAFIVPAAPGDTE
jgi:hypothetical protein